jgi:hypothetical protein
MPETIDVNTIKKALLEVVKEQSNSGSMQAGSILQKVFERFSPRPDIDVQQGILTLFYDLFRNGHLAWGLNFPNTDPPFCHVTDQGRKTLAHLSRDPANPDGYLEYLHRIGNLNLIANSYIEEALTTYNSSCFKAAAVMIGSASESVILELRDEVVNEISSLSKTPSKKLMDWRIKTVLAELKIEFDAQKGMPKPLAERLDANWSAFTQQIRAARNDAGHPNSIDPVTPETVHASLLIFPELAKLGAELKVWIPGNFV